jgi:hypothetical protein
MHGLESTNTVATTVLTTGQCPKALPFSRQSGKVGGQTTVEFALICLPFFIILFAIIDFSEIFFYENSLQNSLRESCRFATAGRIIPKLTSSGAQVYETNAAGSVVPEAIPSAYGNFEASRNECIRYWFLSNCVLKNFPISNIVIISASTLEGVAPETTTNSLGYLTLLSSTGGTATRGPGNYNDYVQITATYHVNTITPLFSFLGGYSRQGWNVFPAHVSAIVKNEPALLNFQHVAIYTNEP